MKKVVWLASWYPNDGDRFTGDFIQRHARATAPFQPLDLLFIGKKHTPPQPQINPPEELTGLNEHVLYYAGNAGPGKSSSVAAAGKYFMTFQRWFKQYRKVNGLPDVIHVHVAMRAGLLALYLRKRFRIPYLLTEHWTGYYKDSAVPLTGKNRFYRFVIKQILRNASLLMPVSSDLGRKMQEIAGPVPMVSVPNVVDTRHFYLKQASPATFRFIHVSSMTAIKNPGGILRAFLALLASGANAELVMVGPAATSDTELSPGKDRIRFTGEIAYPQVAKELRAADVFVLFSYRENQPCVILEALCCGLPVIASRTGGIPELIDETNGELVDAGDEDALAESMRRIMKTYSSFMPAEISAGAIKRFEYNAVGQTYANHYSDLS